MKENLVKNVIKFILIGLVSINVSCANKLQVRHKGSMVILRNEIASLEFDLEEGRYSIRDLKNNTMPIKDAALRINEWYSDQQDCNISWEKSSVQNNLGSGKLLRIIIDAVDQPTMIFSFSLYDGKGYFDISAGLINTGDQSIQIKELYIVSGASLYDKMDVSGDFAMVDGFSGGEPLEYGKRLYSPLTRENALKSRNNILLTFKNNNKRNTLMMGGLSYHDYEKFAFIYQSRRDELEKGTDNESSLLAYLNLPDNQIDNAENGEILELKSKTEKRTWQNHEFRCSETASSAMKKNELQVDISNLNPGKPYYLGFSWWRGLWHGDRKDHRQSVFVEFDEGGIKRRIALFENHLLPRFDGQKKEDVEQVEILIPGEAIKAGKFSLLVEQPILDYDNSAGDDNVYLSEVWLRDGTKKSLIPNQLTQINDCKRPKRNFVAELFALDPVGKKVDPGAGYISEDRFYIDISTPDPFYALENYGYILSRAQGIELSMYDFPSVCLWYAEQGGYGGSEAKNTTLGAVNEMKIIKEKGFLNYSRAAVRLVPDSYLPVNQQGWWDDEHWQLEETDRDGSENGRYVKPYETSKKWGKAVTDLGGIPLTYFQAGFRSEDYAKAFPGHMLFNKALTWRSGKRDTTSDLFTSWNKTWTRNRRVWGYDYSDPDFLRHLKEVYENLANGGVKGLMFDYPGYAWSYGGGMEDQYSTTASSYRNIFRMPYEGLGPNPYVHERNMERGTDVSIGYVASMRTENDTDRMDATTVTRCGMRWYKNRVVYNQDTDSKNIARLQANRDDVRAVLTMAYVTTGRLLLANSFEQFTDETYWDITRTFPYHIDNKSARPVDAFINDVPMVYDYKINDSWHQVTFYNPDFENNKTIGIDLAGEPINGALELDQFASYHVYDFWNDKYIGIISGSDRLEQELRPGEARMMSVRKVLDHPQLISTDRHIMQGYLDVENVEWDSKKKILSGTSKVVGDDPYIISLATNGLSPESVTTTDSETKISWSQSDDGLIKIVLKRPENAKIEWKIIL